MSRRLPATRNRGGRFEDDVKTVWHEKEGANLDRVVWQVSPKVLRKSSRSESSWKMSSRRSPRFMEWHAAPGHFTRGFHGMPSSQAKKRSWRNKDRIV